MDKIRILCMIKDEIPYVERYRVSAGIEGGAVAFLIGAESLTVGIKTKGFMHQPVGAFNDSSVRLVERLVTKEGQGRATGQNGMETKLLFLRGVNVEALQMDGSDIKRLSILQSTEDNRIF